MPTAEQLQDENEVLRAKLCHQRDETNVFRHIASDLADDIGEVLCRVESALNRETPKVEAALGQLDIIRVLLEQVAPKLANK